jgi:hypothetical protein
MVWWWLELHLFDGLDLDLEGGRDPPYTCLPAGFSSWLDPWQKTIWMILEINIIILGQMMNRHKVLWVLGTKRTLFRWIFLNGVWKLVWPMWLIHIPAPLVAWTCSWPPYFSFMVSLSSSPGMWSVAPAPVYQFVSTPYDTDAMFAIFSSPVKSRSKCFQQRCTMWPSLPQSWHWSCGLELPHPPWWPRPLSPRPWPRPPPPHPKLPRPLPRIATFTSMCCSEFWASRWASVFNIWAYRSLMVVDMNLAQMDSTMGLNSASRPDNM